VNPPAWWSEPWWRWFLTIALASLVTGTVTGLVFLWVNAHLNAKVRRAADREQRISRVVDAYVRTVTTHPIQYQGKQALVVAGAKSLRDNSEVLEALRRMTENIGKHPLGGDARTVAPETMKSFIDGLTV